MLLQLRTMLALHRLVVDDVETMAMGSRHHGIMRKARATIDLHAKAMGTRASTGPGKSHMSASAQTGRRQLHSQEDKAGRT
jgi:hypothetical protein